MVSIYDVDPTELINKAAGKLKENEAIKPPFWASFAKTGTHKERPPVSQDWWYVRAASILRAIYKLGPVGVSKLRTKYGGRKRRGYRTEHFYKGSGSIIRKILQQLEKAGYIKKVEKGLRKGRIVTPQGESLLEKTAVVISGKKPSETKLERKKKEKKAVETTEEKEQKKKEPSKKKGRPKKAKEIPAVDESAEKIKEPAAEKKEPSAVEPLEEAIKPAENG